MPETVLQGDLYVTGNLRSGTGTVPTASITNASVAPGSAIDATKLQHQKSPHYAQPNATATTETKVIYRCFGVTATLVGFHAGSIAANIGAATVTVDLRKNGTTVLTAVITLNNANTARVAVPGTLSVTSLAAGDVLEVVVVATAGGGTLATGVFAVAVINEMPS